MGKGGDSILSVTPPVRIKCAAVIPGYVYVEFYFECPLCCVLKISNRLSHAAGSATAQAESVEERFVDFTVKLLELSYKLYISSCLSQLC